MSMIFVMIFGIMIVIMVRFVVLFMIEDSFKEVFVFVGRARLGGLVYRPLA